MILGINSHGLEDAHLSLIRPITRYIRWSVYEHLWISDPAYREWNTQRLRNAVELGFRVLVVVQGYNTAKIREEVNLPEVWWQPLNEIDNHEDPSQNHRIGYEYGQHLREIYGGKEWQARIVSAGVAPENAPAFWGGMCDAGAFPDAYAVHIYGVPLDTYLDRVWDPITKRRHGSIPVWCTEFGIDLQYTDEEGQAGQWEHFVRAAEGRFERSYGYALFTDETGQHGKVEKHGIVDENLKPRRTYQWLVNRNKGEV
jgi:hypothetical protein